MNNPLDVKENVELCSSPSSPFLVSVSLDLPFKHPCTTHAFFPEQLSNHCQVSVALFQDLHKI
jgi:hypothetical protein